MERSSQEIDVSGRLDDIGFFLDEFDLGDAAVYDGAGTLRVSSEIDVAAAWEAFTPLPRLRNALAVRLASDAEAARRRAVSDAAPYKVIHYKEKERIARAALDGNDVAREALNPEAVERGITINQLAQMIIGRAAQALGAAQRVSDAETAALARLSEAETPEQCRVAVNIDWSDVLDGPALELTDAAPAPSPMPPSMMTVLAEKMRELRSAGVDNNFEADDLKLCAEMAAHAAEGDANAIQALMPLAEAAGVSVDAFVQQELSRESARRSRVFKIRAAEIAFRKRIEDADDMDTLLAIRDEILVFTL